MAIRIGLTRARQLSGTGLAKREVVTALVGEGAGARLAWRLASGMTQSAAADRFNELLDDPRAPVTPARVSEWENWGSEAASYARRPSHASLAVLARVYGAASARDLITDAELAHLPPVERAGLEDAALTAWHQPPSTSVVSVIETVVQDPSAQSDALDNLLLQALARSRRAILGAMATNISDLTIENAFDEVRAIAREHLYVNSLELLVETVGLQRKLLALATEAMRPDQSAEVHMLSALISLLIADTSASAGRMKFAFDHAQNAHDHALLAGNVEIQAWTLGVMQSSIFNWEERPGRALGSVDKASSLVAHGERDRQLQNSRALYLARLGDHARAEVVLRSATDLNEEDDASFLTTEIGGMFAYPRAKQDQVATVTWLELRKFDEAITSSQAALAEYQNLPTSDRAFGNEASAAVDLAHAFVGIGEPDSALEALAPVLMLTPERRQDWIVKRASNLRLSTLSIQSTNGSPRLLEVAEALADFSSDAVKASFNARIEDLQLER